MRLARHQWIVIIALDVVFRSAFFFLALRVIGIPLALVLSTLHLVLLFLFNDVVASFKLRPRIGITISLGIANALFVTALILVWVLLIKNGRETSCVGAKFNCDWIDGEITGQGIKAIAGDATMQLVINLMPVLVAYLLRPSGEDETARS